jgi:predicted transcriptional regulator
MLLKSFCYDDKLKRNIPQTITLDLDRLRGSFVNKGCEEWRDFSRRILNVGVSEINEKSDDFHLEMDTVQDKMTNKVVKVKFILTSPSLEQTENARAVRKEKLAEE